MLFGRSFLLWELLVYIFLFSTSLSAKPSKGVQILPDLGSNELNMNGAGEHKLPDTDLSETGKLNLELKEHLLYDAYTIGFNKDGKSYVFEGDVVLIGGQSVIAADKIELKAITKDMVATGNVVIVLNQQIFTGSKIHLNWETGDLVIDDASLVANDKKAIEEIKSEVLGLTEKDFAYQADKDDQEASLAEKKREVKKLYRDLYIKDELTEVEKKKLQNQLTVLLEKQVLLDNYRYPRLFNLSERKRNSLEKRRRFWEQTRKEKGPVEFNVPYYFRLSGSKIERKYSNDFFAMGGLITGCQCDEDEAPVWAFRADKIKVQREGYANLYHPVFEIKGLPILYLPYLKIPVKSKRQSGFLMPNIMTGDSTNGLVYTQPVYFNLGENFDMTATGDFIQNRGTRLGVETRYKNKRYSGFELNIEGIRDRIWIDEQLQRNGVEEYLNETGYCSTQDDPDSCEEELEFDLATPNNFWRGQQTWALVEHITPRLSINTTGAFVSDHRYAQDLYLPSDFSNAFSTIPDANAYNVSKARLNYAGEDLFVGFGTYFGDYVLATDRYKGLHMPGVLNLQTRTFNLFEEANLPFPIYGDVKADLVGIYDVGGSPDLLYDTETSLTNASWNSVKLSLVSPVMTDAFGRLEAYLDTEARYVASEIINNNASILTTAAGGMTFNLPLDGLSMLELPTHDLWVHHFTNFSLGYSFRTVDRSSDYGELKDEMGSDLVYFATDRNYLANDGRDVTDYDTMVNQSRFTFAWTNYWETHQRTIDVVEGIPHNYDKLETIHDQAKRELDYSVDRAVHSTEEMFTEEKSDPDAESSSITWHINRYKLLKTNIKRPLYFNVSIAYDFALQTQRDNQVEENEQIDEIIAGGGLSAEEEDALESQKVSFQNLPKAWIGPDFSLGFNSFGVSLSSTIKYDIYLKTARNLSFNLKLPTIFKTNMNFAYTIENSPESADNGYDLNYRRTRTAYANFSTSIIPRFVTSLNLVQKTIDGSVKPQYGTSFHISYVDPSGCWGLRFVREKDLNEDQQDANYLIQLSIIFMGNAQSLDISAAFNRDKFNL